MKLVKEIDLTGKAIFKSAVNDIFHFFLYVSSSPLTSSPVMYGKDVMTEGSSSEVASD